MSDSSANNSINHVGQANSASNFANSYKILEEIPLAAYICDRLGKITFYNSAACHLWGRTPDLDTDFWTGAHRAFNPNGEEISKTHFSEYSNIENSKSFLAKEVLIERPNGVRRNVLLHIKPIYCTKRERSKRLCTF
jgi:PAS domain-containing protein